MSDQVTTAFVDQFTSNVEMLVQQMGSRLRGSIVEERVNAEAAFFDQVGETAAKKRTTRHGDSPQMDTPHARRRVTLEDYEWGDFVDKQDQVRMLINPTNPYARAAAGALGRSIDDEIISAALGNAWTKANSQVALPASQKVAVGAAGLTVAKLREAQKILKANEVDPSEEMFIAVTAKQLDDLLGTTEVTSSDFNSVKALVDGNVDSFLGFNFLHTERLTTDGNGDRQVIAWARTGIRLGIGSDIMTRISERDDKGYSTYIYASMTVGATRMQEKKVVEIACAE